MSDDWPDDYEATFEDFWRELVCAEDGTLDPDKVKRELHDYRYVMQNASLVYDYVTGGRVSKPNTLAGAVIAEADDHYEGIYREDDDDRDLRITLEQGVAKYDTAVEVAEAADAHHEADRAHGLNSTQEARAHRALMDALARYRTARDTTQGETNG